MEVALLDATSSLSSGFQSIATSIIDGIGVIAPIGLTVMGVMLVWRVGIKFFKGVSKS